MSIFDEAVREFLETGASRLLQPRASVELPPAPPDVRNDAPAVGGEAGTLRIRGIKSGNLCTDGICGGCYRCLQAQGYGEDNGGFFAEEYDERGRDD